MSTRKVTSSTPPKSRSPGRKPARDAAVPAAGKKPNPKATAESPKSTKLDQLVALLKQPTGASISQMAKALDWQPHSVRGVISGALKKKQGLNVTSEKPDDGERIYRIA